MGDPVHSAAREGFQDGSFYDQNRPSYTDQLVNHVISRLYLEPSEGVKFNVLELGAGTGKFTRQVLKHLNKGVSYVATEPSEGFLAFLQKESPGLETMACSAVDIPLPDNSVQNIVCAQCFHWFADSKSLTEMSRVLTPNGRIICVWNMRDVDVAWNAACEQVLDQYYPADTPRAITRHWSNVVKSSPHLKVVEDSKLAGITDEGGDKNYIVDHFRSISVIAQLADGEKQTALRRFHQELDQHFNDDQTIHFPFVSWFYCAEKVL